MYQIPMSLVEDDNDGSSASHNTNLTWHNNNGNVRPSVKKLSEPKCNEDLYLNKTNNISAKSVWQEINSVCDLFYSNTNC